MIQDDILGDRRPHLLIFSLTYQLGGAERQAAYLARSGYLQKYFRVSLLSLHDEGGLREEFESEGFSCDSLGFESGQPLAKVMIFAKLLRYVIKHRPSLILSYCHGPNVLSGLIGRLFRLPVIWSQRDEGRHRVNRIIEIFAIGGVRQFISNSAPGVEFLVREFGLSRSRITLIPNGLALGNFGHSSAWPHFDISALKTPYSAMAAHFSEFKDQMSLVLAWSELPEAGHLYLPGQDNGTRAKIEAVIKERHLEDRVHLIGPVGNIRELYEGAMIVLFVSQAEGSPNAVLEAMAAGKAIVATDLPGIRSLMEGCSNREHLLLKNAPEKIAENVSRLLNNAELRDALGRENQVRAEQEFGVEEMIRRTVMCLRS